MNFKKILIQAIPVVLFLIVAAFILRPIVFEGKSFPIHDVQTGSWNQIEAKKFEGIYWTNSLFGGMPTTMIKPPINKHVIEKNYSLVSSILSGGPYFITFLAMLMTYLGLLTIKIDYKISTVLALIYGGMCYNILLMEAGHFNKNLTMIFIVPILTTLIALFKKPSLGNFLFSAVAWSSGILYGHYQILYYCIFFFFFFGIYQFYQLSKSKDYTTFLKSSGLFIAAALFGILINYQRFGPTYEYSKHTIRGKSELKSKEKQDGLDYDYVFAWSPGKMESLSMLAADYTGGKSNAMVSDRSNPVSKKFYQLMQSGKISQQQAQQVAQITTTYWGQKQFSSGPLYLGIILVFFGVLGLFVTKDKSFLWIWASILMMMALSWGPYFKGFNTFMFENFPYYNKFRDTSSCLNMIESLIVIAAGLSIMKFFYDKELNKQEKLDALKKGSIAMLGILVFAFSLLFMTVPALKGDAALSAQIPALNELFDLIYEQRLSIAKTDLLRSAGLFLLAAALCYAYCTEKLKANYALLIIGLIALADNVSVTNRYITDKSYTKKASDVYKLPTKLPADDIILKDTDPHYRVLDLARGNPLSTADASAYHKSIGGYHYAKLMIYQEFADKYILDKEKRRYVFSEHLNLLGMLNTKYIIQNKNQPNRLPEALGNAWFVENVNFVEDADTELNSLATIDPAKTAVVQQKFANFISSTNTTANPNDNIRLTNYIPDNMEYEYNLSQDRVALFSEIYYPPANGWKVFLDGEEIENGFFKANYLIRGLQLPAGKHKLVFKFKPNSYVIGKYFNYGLSILFVLGFGYWLFMEYKKKELA